MARVISDSGRYGRKASKAEAQSTVSELIGGRDGAFTARHGCNYWNYLKAILSRYVEERKLDQELVVKAYPFHYVDTVGSKCSAVILRKDYKRGEHYVEPEMYFEVGMVPDASGRQGLGVAYGFHYLDGKDGDDSRFVQEVLRNGEMNSMAKALAMSDLFDLLHTSAGRTWMPGKPNNGGTLAWSAGMWFNRTIPEAEIPEDLEARVFQAFDELMPFFRAVTSL